MSRRYAVVTDADAIPRVFFAGHVTFPSGGLLYIAVTEIPAAAWFHTDSARALRMVVNLRRFEAEAGQAPREWCVVNVPEVRS